MGAQVRREPPRCRFAQRRHAFNRGVGFGREIPQRSGQCAHGETRVGADRYLGQSVADELCGIDVYPDELAAKLQAAVEQKRVGFAQTRCRSRAPRRRLEARRVPAFPKVCCRATGMSGRKNALGIDRDGGRRADPFDQRPGGLGGAHAAAPEDDKGARRVAKQRCRRCDGVGIGSRPAAGAPGHARQLVRRRRDHVERELDMHGPGPRTVENRKRPCDHRGQLRRAKHPVTENRNPGDQCRLIGEFVQSAFAEAQLMAVVDAGDHQHRDRVGKGLAHRGGDVGHARPGDDEAAPRACRRPARTRPP